MSRPSSPLCPSDRMPCSDPNCMLKGCSALRLKEQHRQVSIDESIAKQLQRSMERGVRMANRLNKLRGEMLEVSASDMLAMRHKLCGAEDMIRQILNDEEPTWPGA